MCNTRDNLAAGKYENKVPFPSEVVPADVENMTVKQVREHKEAERKRRCEGRIAWLAGEDAARELLRADLETEHGVVGNPKAEKLWSLAWEHGHGCGCGDVIFYYEEFVALVAA